MFVVNERKCFQSFFRYLYMYFITKSVCMKEFTLKSYLSQRVISQNFDEVYSTCMCKMFRDFDEGFGMACVQLLGSYFGDLWYSYIHLERKKLMKEQIITVEKNMRFCFCRLSAKNPKLALQQREGIERCIDRIERFIDIWIDRFVEMDEDELESLTWEELSEISSEEFQDNITINCRVNHF